MIVVEEPTPVSWIVDGVEGKFALYRSDSFRPENYRFLPILGGSVVLALPGQEGEKGPFVCHVFTRSIYPEATEEQLSQDRWSGVMWSREGTIELSLEELRGDESSWKTHRLDVAVVSAFDDDPVRVMSGRRTTVQKLVRL